MSWQAQAWVWTLELSPIEKLVALALANYAGPEGEGISPGRDRVCQETGAHEKTVKRAIDGLIFKEHLKAVGSVSGGRGLSNNYTMPVDMERVASFHKRGALCPLKGRSVSAKGALISVPSDTPSLLSLREEPKSEPTRVRAEGVLFTADSQTVMAAWNNTALEKGLAGIRDTSGVRGKHLAARLAENGLDAVLEAIAAVGRSDFCCGAKGWRMDFDTMLTPAKMKKLLEGGFEPARPAAAPTSSAADSLREMQGW